MLYVTTRSERDQYPALRTLGQNRGPDGGLFVPFRLPIFTREELEALKGKSFGSAVSMVLNLLFAPKLDGVEIDFTIGRVPVKLISMNHRIVMAEMWHNPKWDLQWAVHTLVQRLRTQTQLTADVTEWANIAVHIAFLFGIFGELQRSGLDMDQGVDVAVTAGDFSMPMAAWYAREMGLPIGRIICGCDENGAPWDLLHRGELRTNEVAVTDGPGGAWAVPRGLERLIAGQLGTEEVAIYCEICNRGGIYAPEPEKLERLQQGMFAGVISRRRMERVISSMYRSNRYLLGPRAALAYAGLQDYRATAGEGRVALILAEKKPADDAQTVAAAIGVTPQELKERLK